MVQEEPFDADGPDVRKLRAQVLSPWKFRAFLLTKLPLALVAGLRIRHLDGESCEATVPFGWLTQNPFGSTYFAALSMAAEMSVGALGLSVVRASPEPVSMLITAMDAAFLKKATRLTSFRCEAGAEMAAAVAHTLESGESVEVKAESIGTSPDGTVVARFHFTWSFRRKRH